MLAPVTQYTCGKTLKVKGWSFIDGTYEVMSSNGKLTLANNKPAYYNSALKMYLYAIESGIWHFQKTFGAPHAIAFAHQSQCPTNQIISIWSGTPPKWVISTVTVLKLG